MKKNNKNEMKYITNINICIILLIFIILILAILYKYITYQKNIQTSLQSGIDVKELYNTTTEEVIETVIEGENQEHIESSSSDWELLLVNKNHKIPEGYDVQLEKIEKTHKVDKRITDSLNQMLSDARKQGLSPIICSSYRTNDRQTYLYNKKIREYKNAGYSNSEAQELASYWVAIPGTGEHETGLAVDIVSKNYQILDEKQEETEVQKWLMENSYKYGFTLRYPTDKKEITMINYEPWHYRYVGIENATYMKEHHMCLEEYIDYLKQCEEKYKEIV